LKTHYRSPIDYSEESLEQARSAMKRIELFLEHSETEQDVNLGFSKYMKEFETAMEDDFNTPKALSVVFDLVKEGNLAIDAGDMTGAAGIHREVKGMMEILGFRFEEKEKEDLTDELIGYILKIRDEMRKEKRWKEADRIRDFLKERNIIVEDAPDGARWRRE